MPDVTARRLQAGSVDGARRRPTQSAGRVASCEAMDEQAFALLIEPHRRALHLHCYRMLGSLHDADDAIQERMLRAWKGSDRYEPRAQLGAWLHTIARNVCLSAIARGRSHPVELSEGLDHLQPYPDRLLDDLVARETVEPAFITAIQAAAAQTAGGADPARRSRLVGEEGCQGTRGLGRRGDQRPAACAQAPGGAHPHRSRPDGRVRALVQRFMAARDAVDIDAVVALLTEDPVMTMPPERMRIAGAPAIGDFFAAVPQQGRLDEIRLLPTAANRQPALAAYALTDDGKHRPYGLMVLQMEGDLISGIVGFPDPWLFELCGLPSELNQRCTEADSRSRPHARRDRRRHRGTTQSRSPATGGSGHVLRPHRLRESGRRQDVDSFQTLSGATRRPAWRRASPAGGRFRFSTRLIRRFFRS
jgi:RNA polymerase sigma-70 factor, ECF subfamily